ncbi:MAG TPA: enolase C-terminal domain-like protein [Xanthobacteraceae bacterium]|nr:enolase C-terminal domain-like protein [Xanthobacteraceae bacterium]
MGSHLKIKAVEPIAVSLPMKKPVQMAGETVARADNVLIRIEADDGTVGWGEAASAPTMTGETTASMMAAAAHMTPVLLKRAADDFAGAAAAMDAAMYGNSGAKAAIEIALHDLVGRATGRPLHMLFGQLLRQRMPLLAVVGSDDAVADLREAEARYAQGYRAFKIKVGLAAPEADGERTRRVCAALKAHARQHGEACLVSSDANQGYSTDAALRYVRMLGDCGLDFFEQPVPAHDLDGMARVAAAAPDLWIGADEGIHSLDDIARHHERKAARGASLKAIKLGGLRPLFAAGQLCARLGLRINISCKTGESSIASAAAAHVAAVVPEIAWGLTVTSPGLAEDVVTTPLRVDDGHVTVPDGPGLGVEVDERRVRRCQQDFKRVA